jgi:diadenosine tetraphosphate (Ap4A) HIT family hydrolase
MTECVFCNWDLIKEDVLHETENFFVKVGFGITSPSHVLVVSKKHYGCYAEMPDNLWPEYLQLIKKLKAFITGNFSEPFLVEYGVWEQSINHAHIHLILHKSEEFEIKNIVQEQSDYHKTPFEKYSLEKMRKFFKEDGGYIYMQEKGKEYLFRQKSKPSEEGRFCHRPFFTRKGVKGVYGWPLKEEDQERDEEKRNKTKEVFKKFN